MLFDLLVGCCFVGWLAGWLAGWFVGCWLVGCTVFLILEASFYYTEAYILHLGPPCWSSRGTLGHQRGQLGIQGWISIDF